jgi:hypothetical protein
MVRINLLKYSSVAGIHGGNFPRRALIAACIAGGIGILAFAGLRGYAWLGVHREKAAPPQELRVVKPELAPSTYTNTNMVEEVVKEVNDSRLKLRETGMLGLPYEQLSFAEKINYEFLFAKNVCEMLSRTIPAGIGLKSLEVDNFQTVYAAGLGPSKDLVQEMLASLKNEKLTVLPPPYSFIKPNGHEGFRFAFSCKTEFGLNLTDPVVDLALAAVGPRESLSGVLKSFSRIAKQSRIAINKGPDLLASDKVGNYFRGVYQWSGVGSYKDFVKLVGAMYSEKLPCAIKHCSLTAQTASKVKIESQIVVTTKD